MDEEIVKPIDAEALKTVIQSLLGAADRERKSSEPYKAMFDASKDGLRGLLSHAHQAMEDTILNLFSALEELGIADGKRNELWDFLHMLPYVYRAVRSDISEKEGYVCEADKQRELIQKWVREQFLIEK